jgi:hypothetical protein
MGNSITALAPPACSSQAYLARPKPNGQSLIQSMTELIEALKSALAVRHEQQPPVRYVPSETVLPELPAPIEVHRLQNTEPPSQKVKVNRSRALDFFD